MKKIILDDLQRRITINFPPKRIVSLVPSITELLFDLGLNNFIVGITKFCVLPETETENITKIGGTKNFNISDIIALQPDLVIANKEENTKRLVLTLANQVPVFVTNVFDYFSAIRMIETVGNLTGRETQAKSITDNIGKLFNCLPTNRPLKKAIYLIWKKPFMTVNKNTFIHSMMLKASFVNVFADNEKDYPVITNNDIRKSKAEVILLSSEPCHFEEKDGVEIQKLLPEAKIYFVDGRIFSWYGSHMQIAAEYFYKTF